MAQKKRVFSPAPGCPPRLDQILHLACVAGAVSDIAAGHRAATGAMPSVLRQASCIMALEGVVLALPPQRAFDRHVDVPAPELNTQ